MCKVWCEYGYIFHSLVEPCSIHQSQTILVQAERLIPEFHRRCQPYTENIQGSIKHSGRFPFNQKVWNFRKGGNGTKTSLESNSGNSGRKIKWNGNSWEKFSKISVDLAKVVLFTGISENDVPFVTGNGNGKRPKVVDPRDLFWIHLLRVIYLHTTGSEAMKLVKENFPQVIH